MYDIPSFFFVRCQNLDIKSQFITSCRKLFHGKSDRDNPNQYHIFTEKTQYQLFFSLEGNAAPREHLHSPVLEISEDHTVFFKPEEDSDRLYVHFCITDKPQKAKRESNLYTLYFPSISLSSVQSAMTYFLMLNDGFPYGLHLSDDLNEDCQILLKRLFRSLDTDFNGKISLMEISEYNYKIFGYHLSLNDFSSIFQILHEGDEPAFVTSVATMPIAFDDFLKIMQSLKCLGFGHTIYKLIFEVDFPTYMNPQNHYHLNGKPKSLNQKAERFVKLMYNDFPNQPSREQLIELFTPNGGAPQKLTNLRIIEMEHWVEMWKSWFLTEPDEVVRNLLAFGFPVSLINEAFDFEQEKPIVPVVAVSGALTIFIVGSLVFLFQRKHK